MRAVLGVPIVDLSMEIGDLTVSFFKVGEINNVTYNDVSSSHFHTIFEFQYVRHGCVRLSDGESEYIAEEGSFFIVPPNTYHSNSPAENSFSRYTFFFSVNSNGRKKESFSEYCYYNRVMGALEGITVMKSPTVSYDVEKVLSLGSSLEKEKNHLAKLYINMLLADVVAEIARVKKVSPEGRGLYEGLTGGHENERLKYVIGNCIEFFYTTDHTADKIAEELNMSKRNSARLIYEFFGENLSDIITRQRMKMAEMLIRNTDKPLAKISEEVGYKTYVAFFTAFKKYFGISPNSFRQ